VKYEITLKNPAATTLQAIEQICPDMYAFVLEKPLRLVGRNFCLAISSVFASASFSVCCFHSGAQHRSIDLNLQVICSLINKISVAIFLYTP